MNVAQVILLVVLLFASAFVSSAALYSVVMGPPPAEVAAPATPSPRPVAPAGTIPTASQACRPRKNLLAHPSFETTGKPAWGPPSTVGVWGGDNASAVQKPNAKSGHRVLEFITTEPGFKGGVGKAAQIWQLVRVDKWQRRISKGEMHVVASVAFNRLDMRDNARMEMFVWAFSGHPKHFPRLYEEGSYRQKWVAAIETDDRPDTWQEVRLKGRLPRFTRWLALELRAIEDRNDRTSNEFDGFFADDVCLNVVPR